MKKYIAQIGQSLIDICLGTYGSLDFINKLMSDNNIDDINISPISQQIFIWDDKINDDFGILSQNNYSTQSDIISQSNKEFSLEFSLEYN